ncbi:MAG: DUF512 domain-containing protein [Clostridiales bacterium]|nr:DUF512 domain-containing protein [Clostridiales bacterium]
MKNLCQPIIAATPRSPAAQADVRQGETLLAINGEPVLDLVDYLALTAEENLTLTLADKSGRTREINLCKDEAEPLGLTFETSLMSPPRTCRNRCRFCFIDQMPKGARSSLRVKDDDWRLSFIMGNYISLTNVDDAEFARILRRRVCPLFVSVHATDGAVRAELMGNPDAAKLMERLTALKQAGLTFHAQIVLCPRLNDGPVLAQTLADLSALRPACLSVAIVPVGLTKFRDGLYPLRPWTAGESGEVIDSVDEELGARNEELKGFIFLADEWYLVANHPLPPYEHYGDFPQIENGVGLLRLFEEEFLSALADGSSSFLTPHSSFSVAGGTLAAPFFADLLRRAELPIRQYAIENRYFGGNVHVTGLITGGDLLAQLAGKPLGKALLLPTNMLREGEDIFLDGMTLPQLSERLNVPIKTFSNGEEFVKVISKAIT